MSYNAVRQSHEETSLKDILAVILENFGVSKQETDNLVSLLDTHSKSIINKNDNYLFKFDNNEIKFDFGSDINDAIKSSYIMIYLNDSFDMKKIELHFFTDNSNEIVIANYNSDYEFIDLKYDNPENRKIKERIKIEHEKQELQKLERQKKMEEDILFTRIEKNKKIINAIQSKLKFLNDNQNDFEYICNNFLLKGSKYEEWSINSNKKFQILDSAEGLSIKTNIFNTGIVPNNSSYFIQKCKILFDSYMNISSFEFIIKQVKLGDFFMYVFDIDPDFNLKSFRRMDMIDKKVQSNENHCNGFTFEELIHILRFKLSDNHDIYETIPEIIVPSAYDFNSEDFKKRLLIAEMLLV
jgi:hypothetical protein